MDTMKDTKMQPATDAVIEELRELAEDLYVNGYNRYSSAMSQAADKLEQLRAKIEQMERPVPVAEWIENRFHKYPQLVWNEKYRVNIGDKLYVLPGAQTQGEEE